MEKARQRLANIKAGEENDELSERNLSSERITHYFGYVAKI